MKLFLSSYRISDPAQFAVFVGKKLNDIKLGLVFNSKDYKSKEERREKLEEHFVYYRNLGIQIEEVNLLHFKNLTELRNKFEEFDVLWFNGGNTYSLRWAITESGAEKVLREVLKNGIVYGGDSAGAILAGPTLKYYDAADDISVVPKVLYDGLGLTDVAVLPHWGSEEYGHILGGIEEKLQKDGFKTIRLADEEYLMIENGEIVSSKKL